MAVLRIPTPLRSYTNGQSEVPVSGATVSAAMNDLTGQFPALKPHLFKDNGELSHLGAEHGDPVVFATLRIFVFKMNRFAGQSNPPAHCDPALVEPGKRFQYRSADDILGAEPVESLEGRVNLQEPRVDRISGLIADNLVEREAVQHRFEEDASPGLVLLKRVLRVTTRGRNQVFGLAAQFLVHSMSPFPCQAERSDHS